MRRLQPAALKCVSAGEASSTCRSTPQPATLRQGRWAGTLSWSAGGCATMHGSSIKELLLQGCKASHMRPPDGPQRGCVGQQQAGQAGAACEVQADALGQGGRRGLQACAGRPHTHVLRSGQAITLAQARTQFSTMPGGDHKKHVVPGWPSKTHPPPSPSASSWRQPNRLSSCSAGHCTSLAARLSEPQLTALSSRRRLRGGGHTRQHAQQGQCGQEGRSLPEGLHARTGAPARPGLQPRRTCI